MRNSTLNSRIILFAVFTEKVTILTNFLQSGSSILFLNSLDNFAGGRKNKFSPLWERFPLKILIFKVPLRIKYPFALTIIVCEEFYKMCHPNTGFIDSV